jgi:hypothetical protein
MSVLLLLSKDEIVFINKIFHCYFPKKRIYLSMKYFISIFENKGIFINEVTYLAFIKKSYKNTKRNVKINSNDSFIF